MVPTNTKIFLHVKVQLAARRPRLVAHMQSCRNGQTHRPFLLFKAIESYSPMGKDCATSDSLTQVKESDIPDGAETLLETAELVLKTAKKAKLRIASAESCTGGLLSSLLTDVEGYSGLFERGFATYSEDAKVELLGIDPILITRHGAVSRQTAIAMAQGALDNSRAQIAVAITGFAGPGGKREEEGLVHIAAAAREGTLIHRECHFGARGRQAVRLLAARGALELLAEVIGEAKPHD